MKEMCALCTLQGSRETPAPWVPTLQHKKSLQDFPGSTVNEACIAKVNLEGLILNSRSSWWMKYSFLMYGCQQPWTVHSAHQYLNHWNYNMISNSWWCISTLELKFVLACYDYIFLLSKMTKNLVNP